MKHAAYTEEVVLEYVEAHINLVYRNIPKVRFGAFLKGHLSEKALQYFNGVHDVLEPETVALSFSKKLPVFFGGDLVGSSFLVLSGFYEFRQKGQIRTPAKETLVGKFGVARLPVVNYYFEELITRFNESDVSKLSKRHERAILFLSHDIDRINSGWLEGGFDALKKGRLLKALKGVVDRVRGKDPWNNLGELAAFEESRGCTSTFFILPKRDKENADYALKQPGLQDKLITLFEKGFEIGVHGTKGSHQSSTQLSRDCKALNSTPVGNRFHFLHFSWKKTVQVLEDSNLEYDASLGFYDEVGFRNGFVHPFFLFNHEELRCTQVLEIPLNAMDTTFRKKGYLQVSNAEITILIRDMVLEVQKFGGVFSLLWHNNYFSPYKFGRWRALYISLLKSEELTNLRSLTAREIADLYKQV